MPSQSVGRSGQDDVPALRPPEKSGAPTGSSRSKEQSCGFSQRQDRSPPCRVVSRSTPRRTYGDYKRGRREPSAYDSPPGPHGVDRRRQSLRCMDVHIILPHLDIQLSTGNILSFVAPSLGRDAFLKVLCLRLLKQAKDKERKLQKRLHAIDVETEEKIRMVDQGELCVVPPVFYNVSQSQDPSLHPTDPRPGHSSVVTPDESTTTRFLPPLLVTRWWSTITSQPWSKGNGTRRFKIPKASIGWN